MQNIFSILLGGVSGASVSGLIFWLSKRKIDHFFAKELEDHKKKLDDKSRQAEHEIQKLFNKVTMVQQKEFEVLPIAWEKLNEVHRVLNHYSQPVIDIDISQASSESIKNMLLSFEWKSIEIDAVAFSKDKNTLFKEIQINRKRRLLDEAVSSFFTYVSNNTIFMTGEIKKEFGIAANKYYEFVAKYPYTEYIEDTTPLIFEMVSSIKKIENLIQEKLQFDKAL